MSINNKKLQERVLELVRVEREQQDKQWGGPSHDDQHSVTDWITYIIYQLGKHAKWVSKWKQAYEHHHDIWIKIAAIAVAAAESDYRHFYNRIRKNNTEDNAPVVYNPDGSIHAICENCMYDKEKHPEIVKYVEEHPHDVHAFFCNNCYMVLRGLTSNVFEEDAPCEATCSRSSSRDQDDPTSPEQITRSSES